MAKVTEFIGEVKREVAKVTWPTKQETVRATIMVMIMAVIAAIFFFAVDSIIGLGIREIINWGA